MARVARAVLVLAIVIAGGIVTPRPDAIAAITTPPPALYVVGTGSDTFTTASISSGAAGSSVGVGLDPSAVAVTPDGRRAYVANQGSDTVTPLDLTTVPPTAGPAITVGSDPVALAITPDGGKLYVVNNGSGTITPVSIATNAPEPPIVVGLSPKAIALNPDGTKAYVTVGGVDVVWVNLLDRRPSPPIRVGADSRGIAITPNGVVTYVVSRGENKLYLLYEDQVVKTVEVDAQPEQIAINADGTHLYVTSAGASSITDLPLIPSGDTSGVRNTIPLTSTPSAVTFTPDGTKAFVASTTGSSITPITVATGAVGTPATTGYNAPVAVVASPDQPGEARMSVSSTTAIACTIPPPTGVTSQICLANSGTATFDASATTSVTTPVVSYRWNFGDGTATVTTTTPTTSHAYTASGNYLPTVTVTTAGGTSSTRAFTGQTMSRNGGQTAVATASVRVSASTPVNADSPFLYVANFDGAGNGQITPVLSPTSGPTQKLNSFPGGRLPVFPAVAPTGRAIVIPDRISGSLSVTAVCSTGSGVSFVPGNSQSLGSTPNRVAIAPLPTSTTALQDVYAVYATDLSTPALRRFDLTIAKAPCGASLSAPTGTAIPLGGSPSAVAITPNGDKAYAAIPSLNAVVPIDLESGVAGAPILVGQSPQAISITPDGFIVLVANAGSNTVSAIYQDKVAETIDVGATPQDIAISPDGTTAFVANTGGTTVTPIIITDNTGTVLDDDPSPISLGAGVNPTSLTVSPNGTTLWVTSYGSNKLLPVTIATKAVGASLTGFLSPIGVVAAPDQAPTAGLALTATSPVPCTTPIPDGVAAQACLDLGGTVTFNSGSSVARSSPIASYRWDFGDGTPLVTTTTPTTNHTYADPGMYIASVTLTDAAGTSLLQVFTGQTATRNGSLQARGYGVIRVIAPPMPTNTPLLYIANSLTDSITPIAVPTSGPAAVGNSFAAGRLPVFPAVTPDGRAVVTPNRTTGEVSATAVCKDGSTLTFKPGNAISSGLDPNWVAVVPQPVSSVGDVKVWSVLVANSGGSEVRQFVLTVNTGLAVCNAVLSAPPNTVIPVGPRPYGIVITPDGDTAYVSVSGLNAVVPIDLMTGAPGRPIPVGNDPRGLALASTGTLYVTNFGDGTVTPISTGMAPAAGTAIAVGQQPVAIAINPAGSLAFVANSGGTTLTPINLPAHTTGTAINLGTVPTDVVFTLDGSTAYVTSYLGNSVVPVNASTRVVGMPIRGVMAPIGIVASPGVS